MKRKSENKTPLKDTRRIWINRRNPTLLELVFIQKTSNRFDVFTDVHASAKHQPFDSDDFGDGDY